MVSHKGLRPSDSARLALQYSDRFDFPLKPEEIWYWQPFTRFSQGKIKSFSACGAEYCVLKGRSGLVRLRKKREKISRTKLFKAKSVAGLVNRIPGVRAVFVTGALSMQNSPQNDDIDIFVIVSSHYLWFTRVLVVLLLKTMFLRRPTHLDEHSSDRVKDKICDNLYLDLDHLSIPHLPVNESLINESQINRNQNFFLAHEVLQAKCIYDSGGVHRKFLLANSWVKNYLPVAYRETLKDCLPDNIPDKNLFPDILLFNLNFLLFTVQYLYMRSRMTSEKIGLGYAFFHPGSSVLI